MLTCDACDWTAPCVVVQPALSVSVACSLACRIACRIACSLVQLHAAPLLLYGRMPSRMPRATLSGRRRCPCSCPCLSMSNDGTVPLSHPVVAARI